MAAVLPIVTKFDPSGINKAKKGFGGLAKVGTAALAGVAAGFVALAADSVKSAAADLKSQKLLAGQLAKNAKANKTQIKNAEAFLQTLSMQVGVVDDDLRPALGKLVRATGNTKKAQDLLTLALDASAASGKPLATVSDALSKAFNGNETSLARMFPNLKKSKDLMGDLRKMVGGTAKEIANPFDRFNVAVDNLKESFGAKLLPYVTKFVDYLTTVVVPEVENFISDMSNPNSDTGKVFVNLKNAMVGTDGKGGLVGAAYDTGKAINDMMNTFDSDKSANGFMKMLQLLGATIEGLLNNIGSLAKIVSAVMKGDFFGAAAMAAALPMQQFSNIPKVTDILGGGSSPSAPRSLAPGEMIPASPTGGTPFYSSNKSTKNINVKVTVGAGVSGDAVGREIVRRIKEYEKSNGSGWRRGSL